MTDAELRRIYLDLKQTGEAADADVVALIHEVRRLQSEVEVLRAYPLVLGCNCPDRVKPEPPRVPYCGRCECYHYYGNCV